jgi:hypothetical protein
VADPIVIVAAKHQGQTGLDWSPGLTPPDAAGMRQLYEEPACPARIEYVDARAVADGIEAGLLWWGFSLGLSVALIVAALAGRWRDR